MANFQYKSSSAGSWVDVPTRAYHGTYEGTLEVIYPDPQAKTGMGRPCAAVGDPRIIMNSKVMTASGMMFWQSFFSTVTALDAEFWLTAREPRTGTWTQYTGWLQRPKHSRIQVGTGSLNTMYYDVEIVVDLIETV